MDHFCLFIEWVTQMNNNQMKELNGFNSTHWFKVAKIHKWKELNVGFVLGLLSLIEPVGWFEITMEKINSWFLTNIPYGFLQNNGDFVTNIQTYGFVFNVQIHKTQSWITFDLRKCKTIMGS